MGLPHGPQRSLSVDTAGVVPGRALLHQEALDLAVCDVAGPDHDDIGDGAVADPLLLTVDHPGVAVALRGGLKPDRVGAVVRLGQGKGADGGELRHRRQPPLLLFLRAEQGDRLHGKPGLDTEEGAEAAVAAVELEVDQAVRDRAHRRAAVALDPVAHEPEPPQLLDQVTRELGALPVVVDDRQHLIVNEVPGPIPVVALLRGELVGDPEEVGAAGAADGVEHGEPALRCRN
jgi:hypothetical protein